MLTPRCCKIVRVRECDTHYQIVYTRVCKKCKYKDSEERCFQTVMKNGSPYDSEYWKCPHCGRINHCEIVVKPL